MPRAWQDWGTHQLSEFLAAITEFQDEESALEGATERTAEGFEAEIGMVVRDGDVLALLGLPSSHPDLAAFVAAGRESAQVETSSLGLCSVATADLEDGNETYILVGRAHDSPFEREERLLLSNMGRTLGLVLRMLRTLQSERAALARNEERQLLLERLSRIQRSISHRAPLQEVLDSITDGLRQLTGDKVTGLRLNDPDDPDYLVLVSASGVGMELMESVRRSPKGVGAGGVAYSEERLTIFSDYQASDAAIEDFAEVGLQTAMAAPVYENGELVGSLVSASYVSGRDYSPEEQEMLLALAEHASLALTDARTLEAMREATRAKDMFLAMVSHELKTPLTVMIGTLHTLRAHGDSLEPKTRDDLVGAGLTRGKDLQQLIDMLLKGARAELAGVQKNIYLPDLVAEAMKGFDSTREIILGPIPEVWLVLDPVAIHQVVGVLMENAVSHSPAGAAITVTATTTSSRIMIEVRNPGHLPDDVDQTEIFKPFQRGADARTPGVGLGLYIASQLAESIGGRLLVGEADGQVSFSLSLQRGSERIADPAVQDPLGDPGR